MFLEGESLVTVFDDCGGVPIDQVFYRGDRHSWQTRLDYAQALLHRALSMADLPPEVSCAAVDCGGEFITSVTRIVERAVVAAKREGLILESHLEEGGVAGATHEALTQIVDKAIGLNIGGKIGIARSGDHIVVAVFFGIGLLHLNEVAIALGHRVV